MMKLTTISSFVMPFDCLLAIVIGASRGLRNDEERHAALVALAAEFRVPVILISADSSASRGPIHSGQELSLLTSTVADPLADDAVLRAVNHHNRRKMILSGRDSEGAVTFMALSALARGFDVYVVEDVCRSLSDHVHRIAMQRLAQAGAVLMTAVQLRTEWSAFNDPLPTARPASI